ncbi:hypothetical protein [Thermoactinomyces mirandus]|uniref:Uncharacterized protein n=1 Tax=Thermoactinomyces mirandus TaxID=2756294 RepID=A0A7W1XT59_9BACL|nr:hypothetical protein [Thermoactinomyces mirandus]MBA4602823.1 hypothetical protein [Thermoactinomyces mirandus]
MTQQYPARISDGFFIKCGGRTASAVAGPNGIGAMVAPLVGLFLYDIDPARLYELCLLLIFAWQSSYM